MQFLSCFFYLTIFKLSIQWCFFLGSFCWLLIFFYFCVRFRGGGRWQRDRERVGCGAETLVRPPEPLIKRNKNYFLEIRKSFLSLHSRNGRENKTDEEGEKKEAKGDPELRKWRDKFSCSDTGRDIKSRTVRARHISSFKIYNMWRSGGFLPRKPTFDKKERSWT